MKYDCPFCHEELTLVECVDAIGLFCDNHKQVYDNEAMIIIKDNHINIDFPIDVFGFEAGYTYRQYNNQSSLLILDKNSYRDNQFIVLQFQPDFSDIPKLIKKINIIRIFQ